ncbi:MAG: MarR family winged helix-turn-helix transcriptional regulator [Mizugakiibacter sp.]|uniref:MarR family winged helix-turn-helix transcriptional regulator n=1 Tax=Mizugakiibacter sp. TaxID=1972610 RepID=UPI0031C75D36|nr:MarR family winged helix-turn-helix transcriptional regulator [Xanthomonadaceae bacterium]
MKSPHYFDRHSVPLPQRTVAALERLGQVLRQEAWRRGGALDLSPTQQRVLAELDAAGAEGLGLGALAQRLAVSPPTASDAAAALARKGLLDKRADAADARRKRFTLTAAGREAAAAHAGPAEVVLAALGALDATTQETVYRALLLTIRRLQAEGRIEVARMCLDCAHFRPFAHADLPATPHHCALVDAPFGERHLRIDCPDHHAAASAQQARSFVRYAGSADPAPEQKQS